MASPWPRWRGIGRAVAAGLLVLAASGAVSLGLIVLMAGSASSPVPRPDRGRAHPEGSAAGPPIAPDPATARASDPDAPHPAARRARTAAMVGAGDSPADQEGHLFSSNRSGSYQIHLSQGGETIRLTDDDGFDHWWPRLSPDGSMILLTRTPIGSLPFAPPGGDETAASLWTMRPDGSGLTERIPADAFGRLGPARWSPDGHLVTFAATDPVDGRHRLWLADTERFRATPITDREGVVLDPSFSPDGTRLAYVAHPRGYQGDPSATAPLEVFTIGLGDPVDPTRLTFDDLGDRSPSWSPDGRSLAVTTRVDTGGGFSAEWALRIVSAGGDGTTTILSDGTMNLAPRWRPSGIGLVFQRYDPGGSGFRLVEIDLAGGRLTPITLPVWPGGHNDVQVEPVTGPPVWH